MNRRIMLAVILFVAASTAMAQTNTPPAEATPVVVTETATEAKATPPVADIAKTWIQTIGDQTQIVGGYAAVASSFNKWSGTATAGVQGNLLTKEIQLPFGSKTSVKPGLCYLYGVGLDVHLVGIGVAGTLVKVPPKVASLKNDTGLVSKLPGNLESISWHLGFGSQADEARLWVGAAASIKW